MDGEKYRDKSQKREPPVVCRSWALLLNSYSILAWIKSHTLIVFVAPNRLCDYEEWLTQNVHPYASLRDFI